MSPRRAHLIALASIALSFAIAAALYSRLPDPVPTHWDLHGRINGWTPKPWGAYVLPLAQAGTLLLLALVPWLSPRKFSVAPFARTYAKIELVIALFFTATVAVALTEAAGMPLVSMPRFATVSLGLLLVLLGNYFGKLTPNFFVGVRTPWTLASREVWSRTHRLAGWLFVAGGLIIAVGGLLHPSLPLLVIVVAAIVIIPVGYSFAISRTLDDPHDHDDEQD